MPPLHRSLPRTPKPRAASPAERGAEFAEIQRRLKSEAAARREKAVSRVPKPRAAQPGRPG